VSYVSMLERGLRVPPLETLEALAKALGVPPLDLLQKPAAKARRGQK
jgi:transcriptional regulator with XRE-family HTH domain